MINRIPTREILAWMILSLAIILFSVTIAFAQTKSISVENQDGKVHIKIKKNVNGQTTKLDTIFDAGSDVDVDKIIEDFSGKDGDHISISTQSNSGNDDSKGKVKKEKHIIIDHDLSDLSGMDMDHFDEDLNRSMRKMREELNEMSRSLRNMHIHIKDDELSDIEGPEMNSGEEMENDPHIHKHKIIRIDKDLDSLSDDDHFVILGEGDEAPPTLEKVVKSKNGKTVFVYKRSSSPAEPQEKEDGISNPVVSGLEVFPNPTQDKVNLKFNAAEKSDLTIVVLDSNNKQVYSEKLKNFSGEYSKEIDLGGKSKGNYLVKITNGKKSLARKIIVN